MSARAALVLLLVMFSAMTAACQGSSHSLVNSTVSGTVRYEDREYGYTVGLTGVTWYKPVRHALVEVVYSSTGRVLASGATDKNGSYTIGFRHAKGVSAYVRVISSTSGSGVPGVKVLHSAGGPLYAVSGADIDLADGVSAASIINVPADGPAGGAFNILDVYEAAGELVNSLAGELPPSLNAYWYTGSADGTYYSPGGGIHIYGISSDTDEYDDDVLWHEYGHFIADTMSRDDTPGGSHTFSDNDLDLRLSWSEGWCDYFQVSIKKWLEQDPLLLDVLSLAAGTGPTWYVDTKGTGPPLAVNLETPGAGHVYSSNEVAVAYLLVMLEEAPNSTQDVWDVFSVYMPGIADPLTLEEFWDGWVSSQGTSVFVNSVLIDRSIYYMEDGYEPDDTPDPLRLATLGTGEEHYLYREDGSADEDYIAFNVASIGNYVVETYCMKNGANTYLGVMNTDGTTLHTGYSDDDAQYLGSCTYDYYSQYASRVVANITSTGVYYAKVTASIPVAPPDPPSSPYTGRYGTYTLRITKQ